jgi:hypothetical protein
MNEAGKYIYVLILSLWVGGMSFFTFVITPVIFKSYPRDAAGEIVGRLFPAYFTFGIVVASACLLILIILSSALTRQVFLISLVLLVFALCISIYVRSYLHPAIEKVKKEVPSFETTSPEEQARKHFRSLHA